MLISLSKSSRRLIDWIIGLSCLLTSSAIFCLEKVCPKPNLDCSKSTFSNSAFMGFFTLGFQEAKDMISESSDKLENYR